MTTNQTIDGVPRDEIRVPRKLLNAVGASLNYIDPLGLHDQVWALLTQPAAQLPLVDAPAIRISADGSMTLTQKPSAAVDVPFAYFEMAGDGKPWLDSFTQDASAISNPEPLYRHPATGRREPVAVFSIDATGYRCRVTLDPSKGLPPNGTKLYAEQPAPVAVVLPRRLIDSTGKLNQRGIGFMEGYNACLDEVTRLNTKE